MSSENDWIAEHFEVGQISTGHGFAQALACRYCGAFVWDTRKHMSAIHETKSGNPWRNLPAVENPDE